MIRRRSSTHVPSRPPLLAAALVLASTLLGACAGDGPLEPTPVVDLPRELSAGEVALRDAGNDFAFRLLQEVLAREEAVANVTLSPLSASFALGMALNGARVEAVDFADPATVDLMNGWVATETNGRIERLVEMLDPAEVAFLINALYFKAPWVHAFDPAETAPAPFHRADGSEVTVEMMAREGGFRVAPGDGFTLLDLPYGGGAYSMTLLLPDRERSLGEVVAGLDLATWSDVVAELADARDGARIHLPRFRVEYEVKPLQDALVAMGMSVAFDRERADFRAMVEPGATLTGNLYISRVVQKTFIEVNEEGTEAAAATGVGVGVTSVAPTFFLDRPFLFVIREGLSGTILFAGRVADPTAG